MQEYLAHKMPEAALIDDRSHFEYLFKKLKRKSIDLFHTKDAPAPLLEEAKGLIDVLGSFFDDTNQKNYPKSYEAQFISRSPLFKQSAIAPYFSKELVKATLKRMRHSCLITVLESHEKTAIVLGVFSYYCIIVPTLTQFDDESREAFLFEIYRAATIVAKEQRPRSFFMSFVIPLALLPIAFIVSFVLKDTLPSFQTASIAATLSTSFSAFMLFYTGLIYVYDKSLEEELKVSCVKYLLEHKLQDVALRSVIATLKDSLALHSCDASSVIELFKRHAINIRKAGYDFWTKKASLVSPEEQIPAALEHVRYALQALNADQSEECNAFYERQALFAYNFLREKMGLSKVTLAESMDKEWIDDLESSLNEALVKK